MEDSKDYPQAMDALHKTLAESLSEHYAEYVGKVVDVDIAFADYTTYAEFIMSLSNPSCSYTFSLHPFEGPAILDYSLPLAHGLLTYALGGERVGSDAPDAQAMVGRICEERSTMAKIVRRDLALVETTWEPLQKVDVTDATLETDPIEMKIVAPSHWIHLVALKVDGPDFSGLVNLCYPDCTLESVLPKLVELGK